MNALYRPGPMDNIETFVNRKHGIEEPDYLHPLAKPILEETYGVIIYQEQVMQLAQVLSGYSLGEADLLRRAMGKKIKAEMDAQGARFVKGALEKGIDGGPRALHLRTDGEVRGLRLQQVPRRGLRADRLSDRLSQGEPRAGIHRRLHDARHGQHGQALRLHARGQAARHRRSCRHR